MISVKVRLVSLSGEKYVLYSSPSGLQKLHEFLNLSANDIKNFIVLSEKSLKNREHCRLPFLNIFSRSRVIKV